jgi:glycerate dehydrogenase
MNQLQPPNIVVLDGYLLNPGDLSWDALQRLGSVTIYDRTSEDAIVARAQGAPVVLTNKVPLSGPALRALPALRYIGVLATGYNIVDINTARELGITVTNVPTYGTGSVAQFVFALLLELCHHVGLHSDLVRGGAWAECPDFSFWRTPLVDLSGKTLGIVGYGRIGRQVAQIARAFEMRVLIAQHGTSASPAEPSVTRCSLDELLSASDVISLHCPLLPETTGMIDATRLARMKSTAFLINTSRGPLIVDQDLAGALNANRLAGAALDVLSVEPPTPENPLLSAKNCIVTPHIAWATREARSRLLETAVANLRAYLAGTLQNVVA